MPDPAAIPPIRISSSRSHFGSRPCQPGCLFPLTYGPPPRLLHLFYFSPCSDFLSFDSPLSHRLNRLTALVSSGCAIHSSRTRPSRGLPERTATLRCLGELYPRYNDPTASTATISSLCLPCLTKRPFRHGLASLSSSSAHYLSSS